MELPFGVRRPAWARHARVALEGAQVADLSPINGGRIIPLGLVVGASADG